MTRETSIDAYHKIEAEGLLSRRRWEVYSYLFRRGPLSARDIYKVLCSGNRVNPSSYLSRLSELRDLGVVKEVGEKVDEETGMTVIVWDVTSALPRELDREKIKPTRAELIAGLCEQLEFIEGFIRSVPSIKIKERGEAWFRRNEILFKESAKYRKKKGTAERNAPGLN